MQLNDILEENSIKAISKKTKISEENLEELFKKNFDAIKKIKALGFISILEREYHLDLSDLKEEAREHYADMHEDQSVTLGLPIAEESKGKSKFFVLVVLILLGYVSWYFFTQFDKKTLSEMIPFVDESTFESFMGDKKIAGSNVEELSIAKVNSKAAQTEQATEPEPESKTETLPHSSEPSKEEDMIDNSVEMTERVEDIQPEDIAPMEVTKKIVSIVPVHRLWFGLVNTQTFAREHFSISDSYDLDVSTQSWLVATSSAAFSLQEGNVTKAFNDAKEHYFKIDANGIESLSKSDYVALGGWPQW